MRHLTLVEVLAARDTLPWNHAVFIDDPTRITTASACIVMDTSNVDLDAEGGLPKAISDLGYREFLQTGDLTGIAENLRQQRPGFGMTDLLDATRYYFERDAYVQF